MWGHDKITYICKDMLRSHTFVRVRAGAHVKQVIGFTFFNALYSCKLVKNKCLISLFNWFQIKNRTNQPRFIPVPPSPHPDPDLVPDIWIYPTPTSHPKPSSTQTFQPLGADFRVNRQINLAQAWKDVDYRLATSACKVLIIPTLDFPTANWSPATIEVIMKPHETRNLQRLVTSTAMWRVSKVPVRVSRIELESRLVWLSSLYILTFYKLETHNTQDETQVK